MNTSHQKAPVLKNIVANRHSNKSRTFCMDNGHLSVKSFLSNRESRKSCFSEGSNGSLLHHISRSVIKRSWLFYDKDNSGEVCVEQLLRLSYCLNECKTRSRLLLQEKFSNVFWDGCLRVA